MKKIVLIALLFASTLSIAQSFGGKGSSQYSISINSAHYHHINDNWSKGNHSYGLIGQGEYGVHEYLGVGWQAGIGWGRLHSNAFSNSNTFYFSGGATFNFHFYQLISDKVGTNIFADQLDIYAGINLGAGFGTNRYENIGGGKSSNGFPVFYGGGHLGIRWYPKGGKVGIIAEGGYGKSYGSFGAVFKL